MELLYNQGKNCLKEKKQFYRYNSILYFEQVKKLDQKYLNDKSDVKSLIDIKLFNSYSKIIQETKEYLDSINNGAVDLLKKSDQLGKLILDNNDNFNNNNKNTRLSFFNDKMEEKEALECLLKNYERLLQEIQIQENRLPTEEEAFTIANIIHINMNLLGNNRYEYYQSLSIDCENIVEKLSDNKIIKSKEWYKKFVDINKELKIKIRERKKAYNISERIQQCSIENKNILNEIKDNYQKTKEEFIKYILEKFPYDDYKKDLESNKIDFTKSDQNLWKYLCSKYNTDDYDLANDDENIKKFVIMDYIYNKIKCWI